NGVVRALCGRRMTTYPNPTASTPRSEVLPPRAVSSLECFRISTRVTAAVSDPGLRILSRVLHFSLDDPHFTPNTLSRLISPLPHALFPRLVHAMFPIAQKLGDTSGRQILSNIRHKIFDEFISAHTSIPIFIVRQV